MSRLRAELLDAQVFCNLADARLRLENYQRFYNEQRPHSALSYQTPDAFAADVRLLWTATNPPAPLLCPAAKPPILAPSPVGLPPPSDCAKIENNCDTVSNYPDFTNGG